MKDRAAQRMSRWDSMWHPGRREQLAADAAGLRRDARQGRRRLEPLHTRMRELEERGGGEERLRRAPYEAEIAVACHARDRQAAHREDFFHLRLREDSLNRLHGRAEAATERDRQLRAEQHHRAAMDPADRIMEMSFRLAHEVEQLTRQRERAAVEQALAQERALRAPKLSAPHLDIPPPVRQIEIGHDFGPHL